MIHYKVTSLDVWGHGSHECSISYDCPCMIKGDEGEHEEHDENVCDCHYDVNDWYAIGTITIDEETSDAGILAALIEAGFVREGITMAQVAFDDPSCDGWNIRIEEANTGRPVFDLQRVGEDHDHV